MASGRERHSCCGHFGDKNVPEELSAVLRRMNGEMEVRIKKGEMILFPAICKGGGSGIENPIAVMWKGPHTCQKSIRAGPRPCNQDP